MINFCTLFDSYYIHKGIALYLSLEQVSNDFHMYVMAFDRSSYEKLTSFGFEKMTVELFSDYETPDLLAVKGTRTKAEYCWTAGPSVIHHFIKKYNLPEITYLDADLFFMSNPQVVYDEIGSNSVAITEQYIDYSEGGKYCVQFMFFRNDKDGLGCLEWWRDRCIEWCYSRYEDGKFGDQKYLEHFEALFDNVYVIKNRGVGVAPWNMHLYSYQSQELAFGRQKYPLIFTHMHGTRFDVNNGVLSLTTVDCHVTEQERKVLFIPYVNKMKEVYNKYLGEAIVDVRVKSVSRFQMLLIHIRGRFRSNKIASFLWYKVLRKKYNGYESNKL